MASSGLMGLQGGKRVPGRYAELNMCHIATWSLWV